MNINIGKKISTLRADKEYTQEQLAKLCNVSSAAVSKWENNQSYPDISTLPILARIFEISIDELLNFEQGLTTQQIDTMIKELIEKFTILPFEEAMTYCKNLVHTYPNSEMLKLKIAGAYVTISICIYKSDHAQENALIFNNYAKELCQSITTSTDLIIRQGACVLMSSFYLKEQEAQKALDLIQSIPKLSNTISIECALYQQLHQRDQAIHLLQCQLYSDSTQLYMNLFSLINLAFQENKVEEARTLLNTMELLHQCFPIASSFYTQCFTFYAKLKDKENTYRLLKPYIHDLQHMNEKIDDMRNLLSNNPCFSTVTLKENAQIQQFDEEMIAKMLEEFKDLDFIRNDEAYLKIIKTEENRT